MGSHPAVRRTWNDLRTHWWHHTLSLSSVSYFWPSKLEPYPLGTASSNLGKWATSPGDLGLPEVRNWSGYLHGCLDHASGPSLSLPMWFLTPVQVPHRPFPPSVFLGSEKAPWSIHLTNPETWEPSWTVSFSSHPSPAPERSHRQGSPTFYLLHNCISITFIFYFFGCTESF